MEKWEHMCVGATYNGSSTIELWTVSAPRYFRSDRDVEDRPGDQGLELLDELGKAGWELVSTQHSLTGNARQRLFWLKRPAQSEGGWVYSA